MSFNFDQEITLVNTKEKKVEDIITGTDKTADKEAEVKISDVPEAKSTPETEIKAEEVVPGPETIEETDPVKILEKQLDEANEASRQAHDRLLRASAEYENYKKRSAREAADFRKFANEALIKELLTVIDNLERAIESSSIDDKANKSVVEGVEMVLKEFFKVLEKFNLKSLDSDGEMFDPNFHQAVMQEETDEVPENTIIKVMQKGYILHDRLIRPAMVVVAKAKSKSEEATVEK
jgi:molecular chaperone GrpE